MPAPDFLEHFKKFKIKGKLAAACSGGVDSLAMTYLLAQDYDVVALVVDHGLRKESAAEAKRTGKILDQLGIENVVLTRPNKIKSNLQEEARKLRYGLLVEYCKKHKIKTLATAHHAEDNAETFLLRLSRGSGLDGLSAIAEDGKVDAIRLIRPVLAFTKAELHEVLKTNKIKFVEDPTNKTDKYKRNTLRHALEKLEDRELVTARINDAAFNLTRVREFVENEAAKAFKICVAKNVLNIAKLAKLHDEIAYRVLVKVIMDLSDAEQKPRFEKLKRLKNDLLEGKTRTLNGLIFRAKAGKVTVTQEK